MGKSRAEIANSLILLRDQWALLPDMPKAQRLAVLREFLSVLTLSAVDDDANLYNQVWNARVKIHGAISKMMN